jgi:AcrR family transcriptional regulator
VGILSGSLYHHFDAKEEMAEEIFTAYFDELEGRWEPIRASHADARAKFEAMFREAVLVVDRHTAAARLFTHEWRNLRQLGHTGARWARIEDLWLDVIRAGVSEGSFRDDVDATLLFSLAVDVLSGLSGWYRRGARFPIEAVTDAYTGVVMRGVSAAGARGPS